MFEGKGSPAHQIRSVKIARLKALERLGSLPNVGPVCSKSTRNFSESYKAWGFVKSAIPQFSEP